MLLLCLLKALKLVSMLKLTYIYWNVLYLII
jgi:hypothetical protein